MNKTNIFYKIIIIVLILALCIMTYLYFNMRENAKNNLNMFLNEAEQLSQANEELSKYEEKGNIVSITNTTPSYIPEGVQVANITDEEGIRASDLEFNRSPENVKIEVLENTITRDSARILITDNNEDNYGWGEEFKLQKKENEKWNELDYLDDELLVFNDIAYNLDENNQLIMKVDYGKYYGTLENGIYRIVKPVYDKGYINLHSNEFEIK